MFLVSVIMDLVKPFWYLSISAIDINIISRAFFPYASSIPHVCYCCCLILISCNLSDNDTSRSDISAIASFIILSRYLNDWFNFPLLHWFEYPTYLSDCSRSKIVISRDVWRYNFPFRTVRLNSCLLFSSLNSSKSLVSRDIFW